MCNSTTDAGSAPKPSAADALPQTEATSKKGRLAPQVAACLAASLGSLASGAVNGWTGNSLTSMQEDPNIHMGTTETSLIAGIIGVGAIVGSLISGRVMDYLGRRTTLIVMSPVMVAAWVLMALAPYLYLVLIARFICGLMTSFFLPTVSVYNSEVPETRVRGRLSTMSSFFITVGILLSYIAGGFLPWRYSCYVCAAPSLLGMVSMMAMPESPYWLMLKNRRSDAEAALRWLRGPHYDINEDLENIAAKINAVGAKIEYRELLRPRTRRPFFIALFIMTVQQCTGANTLLTYTGSIFQSAGVEDYHMATVYTGLVQLLGTTASVLLMDKMGRRTMIVTSISVSGVFTVMLGVYYYLGTVMGVSWPHAVPLVAVLMSLLGYCFGCRTIPWIASSELFNTTIRSTAYTVCFFYQRTINLTMVQVFPFAVEAVGAHSVFFFFGGACLLFSILASIIVPETRGKSLEQIQEYFESKSKKAKGKNKENCTSQEQNTCSKVDEALLAPAPVAITPPTNKLAVATEKEEITKL